jgi:hypothetical protein
MAAYGCVGRCGIVVPNYPVAYITDDNATAACCHSR